MHAFASSHVYHVGLKRKCDDRSWWWPLINIILNAVPAGVGANGPAIWVFNNVHEEPYYDHASLRSTGNNRAGGQNWECVERMSRRASAFSQRYCSSASEKTFEKLPSRMMHDNFTTEMCKITWIQLSTNPCHFRHAISCWCCFFVLANGQLVYFLSPCVLRPKQPKQQLELIQTFAPIEIKWNKKRFIEHIE